MSDAGRTDYARHAGERGAVMVIVAVMLVALIGFASLVFDFGQILTVRGELQNTTDSASLAGAQMLDRTEEGLERARQEAIEYAQRHDADFKASEVAHGDVVFGHWDPATETFTSFGPDPANPAAVNAVRVVDSRSEENGSPVTLKLAPVIGHTQSNVSAGATAISGGPENECGFPMTVPDCSLESAVDDGSCDHCFVYQEGGDSSQNAGWTDFGEGNVGQGTIEKLVDSACSTVDPETNECVGECLLSSAGEDIKGQHGNFMNKGTGPCPAIQDILLRDGEPAQPFVVRVPVFESTSSVCEDQNFSGKLNVDGYAALEIYGARCGNSDDQVLVEGIDQCPSPPSGKYITARLRCDMESESPPGGGFFGLDSKRSRLVE